MPRKVSLADLQAREAQAQARLARERQTLARLKKQTTQAERTARQARWWALGEAVEATWGAITPAELMAHFRTVHGGALPVPATISAAPTIEEGCDVHNPLAVLAHVVQAILTGHLPAERLLAAPSPQAMRTGTVHTADQGASPATALTNARCTLYSLALLVQDARTGRLPASALPALLHTLPAPPTAEQVAGTATRQNVAADTTNGTSRAQTASVQNRALRDTSFPLRETIHTSEIPRHGADLQTAPSQPQAVQHVRESA